MAKKLKGLKKSKKPHKYTKGKGMAKRFLEPKPRPFTAYDAKRILSRFIAYSKKRRPIKRKPVTKVRRPKPKVIKDAKRKKPVYPSGKRIYSGAVKTRPYDFRLPSKHLKSPYSLTALYPRKIGPKDPRGKVGKRIYKYIGPYPNPLGMNEIFNVKLSKIGRNYLFKREVVRPARGGRGFTSALGPIKRAEQIKLINFIINKLKEVHYDMREYGDRIIDRKIPLRSGKMRRVMKRSLWKSQSVIPRPAKIEMKMFLHANVPYAGVVTGMDRYGSPHVAHNKSIYPDYPKAIDPDAVKKGYYVVLRDLKSYFRKLWRGFKYEIEQGIIEISRTNQMFAKMQVKNMFEVKVEGRNWVF